MTKRRYDVSYVVQVYDLVLTRVCVNTSSTDIADKHDFFLVRHNTSWSSVLWTPNHMTDTESRGRHCHGVPMTEV